MQIYVITNTVNGKQYVGMTVRTLKARWAQHKRTKDTKKSCPALAAAINKYGAENFTIEKLCDATSRENMEKLERLWVGKLNVVAPNGYNLTHGGEKNRIVTEQVRAKMSESAKNKHPDVFKRHSETMREWFREDPSRKDHIRELGKAAKGRKQPEESVRRRAFIHRGFKFDQQGKINLARAHMAGRVIQCSNGETYLSAYEAALATGACQAHIGSVCRGARKSSGGFTFEYSKGGI